MGFENLQDFTGVSANVSKGVASSSLVIGASVATIFSFIEEYSGLAIIFWLFLLIGAFADIFIGWLVNVFWLKHPFESKKFYRGIFKAFIVYIWIFLTYGFVLGFKNSDIEIDIIKTVGVYTTSTLHYSIIMLIGFYLLLGISENMAKLKIPLFISITKIFKMKINKIEETGSIVKE